MHHHQRRFEHQMRPTEISSCQICATSTTCGLVKLAKTSTSSEKIFAGWLFDIDETDPVNDKVRYIIVDWLATLTIWKTHFQSILSDVMEKDIDHDLTTAMNELQMGANEEDSAYNTWKPKVKPYLRDEPVDHERSLKRRKTDEDVYAEVAPWP